ncbi:hypothetical protein [Neorhizobium sp. T7_12]|uniref:hypothetical protein n=1 Tax=Neorhizobium sp. T7_12 TaxID=2093832 RepID=UPI00197F9C04|nr:hypothetical protein [Neorhizobium sp. T7_12]
MFSRSRTISFTDRSDCFTAMIVQQPVKNTRRERHEIKALIDNRSAQGCKRFEFLKFRTKPKFEILAIGSGESLEEERLKRTVIADSGVWVGMAGCGSGNSDRIVAHHSLLRMTGDAGPWTGPAVGFRPGCSRG